MHFRHATTVPFENIDIQLGRPISLQLPDLKKKLVDDRRGGYCFEQNSFFLSVLKEIGFDVIACEARVRYGIPGRTPRTHMVLIARLDGQSYLCDVGFGAEGLFYPVPFSSEGENQFGWEYRINSESDELVLQSRRPEGWFDLYAFIPQERYPIDFEVANWFTSTYPQSPFVKTLTAQIITPESHHVLRNRTYTIMHSPSDQETREIGSREELLDLLDSVFHLSFPATTKFNNPAF